MNDKMKALKGCILAIFLFINTGEVFSQMNVMLKPANPYRFQTEDVWNINVISPITTDVIITARVAKQGIGDIFISTSNTVSIKVGANSLSKLLLSSARVEFQNSEIKSWVDAHLSLPPGHYTVCYVVRCAQADCGGAGSIGPDNQYCSNFAIETPSPLLLSFPANESVIEDKTPLLVWIPPSPVSKEVTYELRLVKVQDEQGRQDAISRNIPIMERAGIEGTSLNFPVDIDPLVEGETYAWEVYANLFGERIARSEVWEFTIGKDTIKKKEDPFNYIKIRQVNPTSIIQVESTLRLDYHEQVSKTTELTIDVLTLDGKHKGSVTKKIVYGENLLDVSLSGMGLKPETEYLVQIKNASGEHFEIKIAYSFSY
ncbi:MAG: hypothetical protein ACYC1Q_12385 [Bacteroidia bacterium]